MNVGMPGLGLGGLFYLICGLAMPALELMSRGRGSPATRGWRAAWMQCAVATASLAAVVATVGVVSFIAARMGNGFEPVDLGVGILTAARSGISPLSVVLLALLLSGVEVLHFIARRSARPPARSAHASSGIVAP